MSKNQITLSLQNDNGQEGIIDNEAFEKKVAEGLLPEEEINPAIVASTVDHPITIKYGEDSVRISGRARLRFADYSKLPNPMPKGLSYKKVKPLNQ